MLWPTISAGLPSCLVELPLALKDGEIGAIDDEVSIAHSQTGSKASLFGRSHRYMNQPVVGYHRDEHGDWVADLACGHGQHVRHQPLMTTRAWVLTEAGRTGRLVTMLNCQRCEGKA
jgi:hypothetical protein